MEFRGDDRAQSIQVGAILLFGILMIAAASYQVTVVPQENAQVEYNHNREVRSDVLNLRSGLLEAARTGETTAATVRLGTNYPARSVFINPPPPSGQIRTIGTNDPGVNITITGARPTDRAVSDFWNESGDGETVPFETGAVLYEPSYNEFRNAPRIGIDSGTGVVYTSQTDSTIPITGQRLVDGREINLVLLSGNLSRSGTLTTALDPRPVSSSDNVVPIRSDDGPFNITFSTRLNGDRWDTQNLVERQENVLGVTWESSTSSEWDVVTIQLAGGITYRLDAARVALGTDGESESGPGYITVGEPQPPVIYEGTTQTATFELRDRLNNPVGGEPVTVTLSEGLCLVSDSGGCKQEVLFSGHGGTISVDYRADTTSGSRTPVSITATFGDGVGTSRAQLNHSVVNVSGGTGSDTPTDGGGTPDYGLTGSNVSCYDENGNDYCDPNEQQYTAAELEDINNPQNKRYLIGADIDTDSFAFNGRGMTIGRGVSITATNDISLSTQSQQLNVSGATIRSEQGSVSLSTQSADIDASGATLEAANGLSFDPKNNDLDVQGATLEGQQISVDNSPGKVRYNGNTVIQSPDGSSNTLSVPNKKDPVSTDGNDPQKGEVN